MLNLAEYYKQRQDQEQIAFSILKADITEADLHKIVITDKEVIEKLNFVKTIGPDQDQELLQKMDKVYQMKKLDESSKFSASAFDP